MQRIFFIITALITILTVSCKKFVEIPAPKNELVSENVFTNDRTATAAVVGIYSTMNAYNYYFANVLGNFLPAMSADEFYYRASYGSYDEFKNNAILPGNSFIKTLWSQPYSYIYAANACLEGLGTSTGVSEDVKNRLMGEAHFIRAFCHFYLVNMFGDVPLITVTDYKVNNTMPRIASSIVYDTIIADLKAAQQLIPESYADDRSRPNKAAATAFLARAYLYTGQWAMAEAEATKVIDDAQYQLLNDLDQVFLKNSGEAIWQLAAVNTGRNTWEGFNMVPVSAPYYVLTEQLNDAFETGDLRHDHWVGTYTSSSATYYYPYKYKVRYQTEVEEYSMVFRLAEQYLIRAEARAQQDKPALAQEDLDSVRSRAGLPALAATSDKATILDEVAQERRVELFSEWGHRWYDLKRTQQAGAVLSPVKPDWQATDTLYPLPTDAILSNVYLEQNKGYE